MKMFIILNKYKKFILENPRLSNWIEYFLAHFLIALVNCMRNNVIDILYSSDSHNKYFSKHICRNYIENHALINNHVRIYIKHSFGWNKCLLKHAALHNSSSARAQRYIRHNEYFFCIYNSNEIFFHLYRIYELISYSYSILVKELLKFQPVVCQVQIA